MQQIKTKELPNGYFVTATPYPSGNVEFLSFEEKYKNWKDVCGCQNCNLCKQEWHHDGFKSFGNKHIQLIAANPTFEMEQLDSLGAFMLLFDKFRFNLTQKDYELIYELNEQGKDFFIYKVSEEK